MKRCITVLLMVLSMSSLSLAQGNGAVSTPVSRDAVVATLSRLTRPSRDSSVAAPVSIDPFSPPPEHTRPGDETQLGGKVSSMSDEQLVEALIALIQPTGSMMQGGEPYLLFTERRQKIGDKVTVTFDKVEYIVEIISISGNRFRVRYNDKEAERTIK